MTGRNTAGWRAEFNTDGTGDWQVTLPADASFEDLEALAPVIDEMREFIRPTVDVVPPPRGPFPTVDRVA